MLEYTEYTIENGEHYALQSSPLVSSKDTSVAHTRTGDRAYYYWLYPNFMINIYEGVMDTNLVLPLGQDRCLVVFDFFFADTVFEREQYNARALRSVIESRQKMSTSANQYSGACIPEPTAPAACLFVGKPASTSFTDS